MSPPVQFSMSPDIAMGIALGWQAYVEANKVVSAEAAESVGSLELVLASAPFFMVALAELTKIPVATLLFSASWLWKPVLVLLLGALLPCAYTGRYALFGLPSRRFDLCKRELQRLDIVIEPTGCDREDLSCRGR